MKLSDRIFFITTPHVFSISNNIKTTDGFSIGCFALVIRIFLQALKGSRIRIQTGRRIK